MDFELDAQSRELIKRTQNFMDEFIYPAEPELAAHPVGNFERPAIMEDLKSAAKAITSSVADVRNIGDQAKVQAGSITAALFLQRFIGSRNWVHLDIAGAGRSDVDAGENVKGATGYGVRLLTQWLASAPTIRSARAK